MIETLETYIEDNVATNRILNLTITNIDAMANYFVVIVSKNSGANGTRVSSSVAYKYNTTTLASFSSTGSTNTGGSVDDGISIAISSLCLAKISKGNLGGEAISVVVTFSANVQTKQAIIIKQITSKHQETIGEYTGYNTSPLNTLLSTYSFSSVVGASGIKNALYVTAVPLTSITPDANLNTILNLTTTGTYPITTLIQKPDLELYKTGGYSLSSTVTTSISCYGRLFAFTSFREYTWCRLDMVFPTSIASNSRGWNGPFL